MCENMTPSITPEVCDLSPSEKNRATAMGSMQTKFGDVRTSGFRDMLLDRHSQTRLSEYSGLLPVADCCDSIR